jgi:16S rRNA C967 or C1407 C5-methylase (RsmB/RsmF family)/NOL1/NOP2/fmu family ribosome biogenesis protein
VLPEIFLESLEGIAGFNRASFVQVHEGDEQVSSLRVNTKKISNKDWPVLKNKQSVIPWCENGYYLSHRPSYVLDPLWHAGAYYVQEASSMFLSHILHHIIPNPQRELVLDLCAAPGGKSTLLADYFSQGLVVANETIKSRNAILVENATKWGADHMVITQNDPSHFKILSHFFDVLVIDAPCSGSGLFRRDKEAIKEWSIEAVTHCSIRQQRILEDSLDCLKEGGYLIYSTCSYSFEEDEKIMDKLVKENELQNIAIPLPEHWNIIETSSPLTNAKGYRFYPDKIKGEGFFIAVFQKTNSHSGAYYNTDISLSMLNKKETALLNSFFEIKEAYSLIQHQGALIAFDSFFEIQYKALLKNVYVKKMGLNVGEFKGSDLIPSHALAMSDWKNLPYATVEVDLETALQFLRRADLHIPDTKGWTLVKYLSTPLGWIKGLPNRSNNYYPNEWRILKY